VPSSTLNKRYFQPGDIASSVAGYCGTSCLAICTTVGCPATYRVRSFHGLEMVPKLCYNTPRSTPKSEEGPDKRLVHNRLQCSPAFSERDVCRGQFAKAVSRTASPHGAAYRPIPQRRGLSRRPHRGRELCPILADHRRDQVRPEDHLRPRHRPSSSDEPLRALLPAAPCGPTRPETLKDPYDAKTASTAPKPWATAPRGIDHRNAERVLHLPALRAIPAQPLTMAPAPSVLHARPDPRSSLQRSVAGRRFSHSHVEGRSPASRSIIPIGRR